MRWIIAVCLGLVMSAIIRPVPWAGNAKPKEEKDHAQAALPPLVTKRTRLANQKSSQGRFLGARPIPSRSPRFALPRPIFPRKRSRFDGDHGKALVKGLEYVLANQDKGMFKQNGHSWIHGQEFRRQLGRWPKPMADRSFARPSRTST